MRFNHFPNIALCSPRKYRKFLHSHWRDDLHSVSVLFAFQTLFGNYVTCLTGLIAIVDPGCFGSILTPRLIEELRDPGCNCECMEHLQGKIKGHQHIFYVTRVSCLCLVYYLRFQSLHQLHYPKRNVLSALNDMKHASAGYLFEDILLLFVGMTLKRLQH